MRKAYLEIGALFEDTWTGIPNVVAALAEGALNDKQLDWSFLYETIEIPVDQVRKFLVQRSGRGGLSKLEQLAWDRRPLSSEQAAQAVCVFPNIKPVRRFFHREAMIVHDLSPLLTPQFHNKDNIDHFANRIREDVETSDHIFCVSGATLGDVAAYFKKPVEQMSVIHLGVDLDPADVTRALPMFRDDVAVEPYIVVLGTLEPRKNGGLVLDYLAENQRFADRYRIVFIGREGWLDGGERLKQTLVDAGVRPDRVVFTGYVSDTQKTLLMLNAAFCVYPSFFEGFGLPVLEASALGKITVCSNTSSIPEVAPESCVFFDPLSSAEFSMAMRTAELVASQTRSASQSLSDIEQRAVAIGWDRCYSKVAAWVKDQ